ncbi:DedA family membrane protein [Weissella oryzae SG25]|uniref:DedA family membrane protein n=1 Tax=Weissella oryzae (strain DSM 25784 / JCM 18191 / LMG 30913 / SG25) TaxID=1329250 RepID=A0A069CYH0_WEIOS|nr:VTT domain-containing protein [Weissella oryzae]GAK30146.1 DedA family membrane protein [Weissella oryzae SG25]
MLILAESMPVWLNNITASGSMFSFSVLLILFLLIFIETAGIFVGFIPGDTILLALGSFAGESHNFGHYLLGAFILGAASLAGDAVNYYFGAFLLRQFSRIKWIDKHINGATMGRLRDGFHHRRWLLFIVVGRFVPFIRTLVPLLAHELGLAFVNYIRYAAFASFLWSFSIVGIGYFFGHLNLPGGGIWWVLGTILLIMLILLRQARVREWIIRLFLHKDDK